MTSVFVKRMRLNSADFRFQACLAAQFVGSRHCAAAFSLQVLESFTDCKSRKTPAATRCDEVVETGSEVEFRKSNTIYKTKYLPGLVVTLSPNLVVTLWGFAVSGVRTDVAPLLAPAPVARGSSVCRRAPGASQSRTHPKKLGEINRVDVEIQIRFLF